MIVFGALPIIRLFGLDCGSFYLTALTVLVLMTQPS